MLACHCYVGDGDGLTIILIAPGDHYALFAVDGYIRVRVEWIYDRGWMCALFNEYEVWFHQPSFELVLVP